MSEVKPWLTTLRARANGPGLTVEVDRSDIRAVLAALDAYPRVQGRCPACGGSSLFLGEGGYVTCSWSLCREPDAATTILERGQG